MIPEPSKPLKMRLRNPSSATPFLAGTFAGTVATLFHTAAMFALQPWLPRERHRRLPPAQITSTAARRARTGQVESGRGLRVATAFTHFGFGAAAGSLYPLLAEHGRSKPVATGIGFGVAVWAASYLGWIPALRLLPPATQHSAQRNAMMILAHVAWGAALGLMYDRMRHDRPASAHGERS